MTHHDLSKIDRENNPIEYYIAMYENQIDFINSKLIVGMFASEEEHQKLIQKKKDFEESVMTLKEYGGI